MVDTTIRIIVDPDGAVRGTRVVNRSLDSTTQRAQATTSAVQFLRRAIGLLGVGLGITQLVRFADTFTEIQNRLRVAGFAADELTAANQRLLDISNRTRTSFETNAELLQRLSIASEELGASQEQLFEFTETVGQALAIQGGAAGSASGALLQLSQAIGSGIVRAEEFNSILEGALPIAQAAARGIDEAGGSVARLRTLVIEGRVTSEQFFNAILSQGDALQEQFARTTPTIGQALTVLNNNLIDFIGSLDSANGLSGALAQTIITLSNNLETAARVAAVLASTLAPAVLVSIASGLRNAALAAAAFAAALGPIGLIASALTAAAAAVALFGEELTPVEGSIATLQDIGVATFDLIKESVVGLANDGIDFLTEAVGDFGIDFERVMGVATTVFGFFRDVVFGVANFVINQFRAMLESARTFGEVLGKVLTGDFAGAVGTAGGLTGRLQDIFSEDVVGAVVGQAGILVDRVGDEILRRAEDRRRQIEAESSTQAETQGFDTGGGGRERPIELTKQQATALRQLQDELDPVAAAQREVAEAQELLSTALAAGVISLEEFTDLSVRLGDTFREQLDPLGAINEELRREGELLSLGSRAREVEIELRAIENDLKQQGVQINEAERESLRSNLQSLFALNEALETQERLLEDIRGPQEEYGRGLQALDQLLMDGLISFEEFDERARELRLTLLDQNEDLASGFERGLERAAENFNDFASLAESSVARAFRGMEDALVGFVETGKFDFSSLADSIISDLIRITVRQQILGPLTNALSGGGGGGGGGGGLDSLLSSAATAAQGFFAGGFQSGGSFTVPGVGGADERLVALRATPGEEISVTTPGTSGSGGRPPIVVNNSFNFPGGDASSIRRNQTQVAADAQAAMSSALRRIS